MTDEEKKSLYIKTSKDIQSLNMQYHKTVISGSVAFAGSLFGVIQGLAFFKTEDSISAGNIFLIIGISLFVLVLAAFFSHYTRFMEKSLEKEIKDAVTAQIIIFDGDGRPTKISETLIFLFLFAEGLVIFSKISFLMYQFPYIAVLWIILYLLASQQICFNTMKLLQFYPKE